jgi:hypothetical protein
MLDFQNHIFDKPICLEVLLSYRRHYARFESSSSKHVCILSHLDGPHLDATGQMRKFFKHAFAMQLWSHILT